MPRLRADMGRITEWLLGIDTANAPEMRADDAAGIEIPARDAAPLNVTPDEALGLIAVYRAVSIRVIALKQMSLDVERGGAPIDRPAIIRRPNLGCSLAAFLEMTAMSRELTGNAYWRKLRDASGVVREVEVLNPHEVSIRTNAGGRVIGYTHRGRDLAVEDVQHLPKLRIPGTPYGLGPIQAARAEIRGAVDLRDYASGWINSGDVPSGVLSTSQTLTDDAASKTKKRWRETRGGRREVAVLGNGFTYSPVYLSPADAQFLESQQWNTTSIARLFGVPASLMLAILDGNSMTYANVSQEWLAFVRFGLADDIREIEDAFTDLLPRGQRARFNTDALLRMDTESRYRAHAAGISAGWLLPSEVRAIENLPEHSGIDDRVPAPASRKAAA